MSGSSGLGSGLKAGRLQGLKTGLGQSSLRSGLVGGVKDGISIREKMQDPLLLTGVKKPVVYGLADYFTQPTGTTTTLTDIASTGVVLTNAQGGSFRPSPIAKGIFNNKYAMDLTVNSASCFYTSPTYSFSGLTAITMIMVAKLNNLSGKQLIYIDDSITPGGVDVSSISTSNQLRSIFYGGSAGTITNSQYDTSECSGIMSNWMIFTAKYRLSLPQGAGSEQEMYVNGKIQRKLNSSTFTAVTSSWIAGKQLIIGCNAISGGSNGGNIQMGAFVMLPYWANESEQLRLENYFRYYYGNKF
jgi:hypothetical protein